MERHDAVIIFVDLLPVMAQFLEYESVRDVEASLLLTAMHDPGFSIGLLKAESVLAHTVVPSRELQSSSDDIAGAYCVIRSIHGFIAKARDSCKRNFAKVFHLGGL